MSKDVTALVELWRETRAPELSELIDRLSTAGKLPYPKSAKTDAKQARWMKMSDARSPADLPALLTLLLDAYTADASARVEAIGQWPDDPRISSALALQFERPSQLNVSTLPVWEALGELIIRYADPRTKARLDAVAKLGTGWTNLFKPFMREPIGAFLTALRSRLERSLASRTFRALTSAERAAISAAKPAPSLEDAVSAVWASPDDLGCRLVYADLLTSAGDPRGEFITLQCLDSPTTEQRRRATSLLTEHGKSWAGPLAPVVDVLSWERGFPAAVKVKLATARHLAAALGHPAWSTIHTVEFETVGYGVPSQLVVHPSMTRVLRVGGLCDTDLRAIARLGGPFPFRSLVVYGFSPNIFKHLGASIFPQLVHLQLIDELKLSEAALEFRKARPEVSIGLGLLKLDTATPPARLR